MRRPALAKVDLAEPPSMLMILICFIAPWLAMFLRGHILQGILCIILHLTIIGWIPATIWALYVTQPTRGL